MSSDDSYSRGSQSTLSEEAEQIWQRYVAGRQRERRLDCSECEAAAASRDVVRSGSSVPEQRSWRTRRSSRPDSSLSGVNRYGVTDTESLITGRSFSTEGDAPVPSVHWVRALCLALMALSSALFIGAVSLALMHSLPETWPTPPSGDAKVHGAASAANPSQDKAGQHPVVQDAARLEHAPKEHVGAPSVAAATTRTSTPTSAGGAPPESTDVQDTAIQHSARHEGRRRERQQPVVLRQSRLPPVELPVGQVPVLGRPAVLQRGPVPGRVRAPTRGIGLRARLPDAHAGHVQLPAAQVSFLRRRLWEKRGAALPAHVYGGQSVAPVPGWRQPIQDEGGLRGGLRLRRQLAHWRGPLK
ncbi:uncharacterized protein [Dermacentor albipictus]|uniref:uncharacterized protein isoform X2 n=1 Tax=Dermacentor albipictus TaxID=60249 RepID=UPI0031FBE23D